MMKEVYIMQIVDEDNITLLRGFSSFPDREKIMKVMSDLMLEWGYTTMEMTEEFRIYANRAMYTFEMYCKERDYTMTLNVDISSLALED